MCANTRLIRLLMAQAGETAAVSSSTQADWSSVTFSGTRHQVCLNFTDKEHADAFVAWVNNAGELEIPGSTLIELTVLEEDEIPPLGHVFIVVEALTLNN